MMSNAVLQSQGHSGLMGEKGSNNAIVNIGTGQPGKSIIGLSAKMLCQ
jgi:hypothetical protein